MRAPATVQHLAVLVSCCWLGTIMAGNIAVLVVEDEVLIRMDVADQLTDEGYTVFEAGNAAQAVAILEMEPSIQILFTDIDMAGSRRA